MIDYLNPHRVYIDAQAAPDLSTEVKRDDADKGVEIMEKRINQRHGKPDETPAERIVRRPRLTAEQVRVLEALYEVFDFKWLAKQKDGQVMAYANRPNKSDDWYGCWFSGEGDNEEDYGWKVKASSPVCGLISWSDPAPLDIVQVLRQNILEVEG